MIHACFVAHTKEKQNQVIDKHNDKASQKHLKVASDADKHLHLISEWSKELSYHDGKDLLLVEANYSSGAPNRQNV